MGWGALARSIDKILTMEELKEKSPLSHRRMMLTSQKKKQKTNNKRKKQKKKNSSTKKKVILLNSEAFVDHTESCSIKMCLSKPFQCKLGPERRKYKRNNLQKLKCPGGFPEGDDEA